MRIAIVQLNYHIGDFSGNATKITEAILKAKEEGASLAVFSELAVTGYYPEDLLEKKEFIHRAEETLHSIARHCTGIAALVGGPAINGEDRGKKLFNAAYYMADGQIRDVFYKTLLPTYDIFDEYRHFEPNQAFRILEAEGRRIAVTLCEDLWDEQPVNNEFGKTNLYKKSPLVELRRFRPELIINLSASPFSANQENWRKDLLMKKASASKLPLVYVNQVGGYTGILYDGGSVFIGSGGKILQELKYFEEDFRIIETGDEERTGLQPPMNYAEKIHKALVMGIRDYFKKTQVSQATLGLSGGIDSAVVAVLAAEALGPENVRVLLMPSQYSSKHSLEDALELAQTLGLRYDIVPIQETVDAFSAALAPLFGALPRDITEENIQARTRGTLLMALSNKFGHILLNTSNKSETAVGYGTLYGDMNGGLSVLGDVYKTDVYRIAAYINRDREIIPRNTLEKAPSAELRPGQKDSDSLPEYALLDPVLFQYIELNRPPGEITVAGASQPLVEKIIRMVNRYEFKRYQAPPVLRISYKAFGAGRRMPLVGRY